MNDRFRFRVWNKHINEYCNIQNLFILPTGETGYFITDGSYPHQRKFMHQEDMIIEQCTGLSDKIGNLIYEGDIVKCDRDIDPDGRVNLTKEVIFTDGTFTLANLDPKNRDFCYINRFHNIEIIGNIHEQAEQKDK